MKIVEHFDWGGQVYVREHAGRSKGRLATTNDDLDALLAAGAIVTRLPILNPPLLIARHAEGEECPICDKKAADSGTVTVR